MNDKYISIITNFGCHYTCPYCIVKNNNLDIPRTTINGLDSLWLEIVLWWYIEQNDYNLYYCQNKVYTEYKNIGR